MQFIAMITMLMDHIGLMFFPSDPVWRLIGRIAFPIYAYALVQGYIHTSNFKKYAVRLLIIGALSQIPYQLAINHDGLNVVLTLLASLLVLRMLDHIQPGLVSIWIIAGFSILMEVLPFDYGAYGLLLVLIFKYARSTQMLLMHGLLNLVYLLAYGWVIQMVSLVPTLMIVFGPRLWERLEARRMPAWIWRSFYPAHLALLAVIAYVMRTG